MINHLPNILTFSRFVASPLYLYLFLFGTLNQKVLGSIIFLVAALTDIFDGYLARKYEVSSEFGSFVDPLADKILVMSAFFAFAYLNYIPWWMAIIILLRDILTTLLRNKMISSGKSLKTSNLAKIKTFSQFLFIVYIHFIIFLRFLGFINYDSEKYILYSNFTYIFMFVIVGFTLYTFLDYFIINKK